MRFIYAHVLIALITIKTVFPATQNIDVAEPYSSGYINFSFDEYLVSNFISDHNDTVVFKFSNGLRVAVNTPWDATTSMSHQLGLLTCIFDTATSNFGYSSDAEDIQVKRSDHSMFYTSTISSDFVWNNALIFPDEALLAMDTFSYGSADGGSEKYVAKTIAYYDYISIQTGPTDFFSESEFDTVNGCKTIFYVSSKTNNAKMKFQFVPEVLTVNQGVLSGTFDCRLYWATDSLGNGIFKPDTTVPIKLVATKPMQVKPQLEIAGGSLILPPSVRPGSSLSIISPAGRIVWSERIGEKRMIPLPAGMSKGVYLWRIEEKGAKAVMGRVLVR